MKEVKKTRSLIVLIFALALSYSTGFLGSLFTAGETTSEWYASVKPEITPPNWIFPLVWNTLYLLFALSLWSVWVHAKNRRARVKIAFVYGANLLTNAAWSFLYFRLHNPLLAFLDLLLLLITIIMAMVISWRINKKASWMLLPYLGWIIFAGILNVLSIV